MAVPVSNFPLVRTVTQLVRSMLADEALAQGFPFVPTGVAASAGIVTLQFAGPPGFIVGDTVQMANWNPATFNGIFTLGQGSGIQFLLQNAAAAGVATGGTVAGYGTGKKYTDTALMPFVNSAYRGLQRALKATGSTEFRSGQAFVTIPALSFAEPSTQVYLGFTGLTISSDATPAPTFVGGAGLGHLPLDLLMPRKLWSRPTGQQIDFQEMVDLTNTGGLASVFQGQTLNSFEWIGDSIALLGGTQANDIKIEYDKGMPPVSDGLAELLVLNSEDYHAFYVAAMADKSRGGKQAESWDQAAEDAKEKLVNAVTRGQQFVSRRPRAFSSRRGYANRGRVF